VIALLLQAAGGGITASSSGPLGQDGVNIMLAGLSWQVFSLAVFMGLCVDFALRVRRASPVDFNPRYDALRASPRFKGFLVCLFIATLTIFVRSVFRCAELSGGFSGALANDEITFMILEGAMISIAVLALTVSHPGLVWKGEWRGLARAMKGEDHGLMDSQYKFVSGSEGSQIGMNPMSSDRAFA
jgi:RTA1 like protein